MCSIRSTFFSGGLGISWNAEGIDTTLFVGEIVGDAVVRLVIGDSVAGSFVGEVVGSWSSTGLIVGGVTGETVTGAGEVDGGFGLGSLADGGFGFFGLGHDVPLKQVC